jgi:hypothetical protein
LIVITAGEVLAVMTRGFAPGFAKESRAEAMNSFLSPAVSGRPLVSTSGLWAIGTNISLGLGWMPWATGLFTDIFWAKAGDTRAANAIRAQILFMKTSYGSNLMGL